MSPADMRQTLRAMTAAIVHRGPDDEGFHFSGPAALGMRRLSIIDLDGGHQPIANEDGAVVVVFNGEIYNYRELTEQLIQRGHRFSTNSDTEVIVHLYEEYGEDCVHHLRGMFGLAIWDERRRKLLVARDRLGIKPLYYAPLGDGLVFGSEIKSLLAHPAIEARPDLEAIGNFISLKYAPAPQTMFEGICSLPPGHLLTWDRRGVRIAQYWDVPLGAAADDNASEEERREQLDQLLRESVRLHLRSDVPFGAFLSGGIDSSLIVALMTQTLQQPVRTFSVGFEARDGVRDELPYARLVAKRFGAEHREVAIGPQDAIELAEEVVWALDQPIADQATLAAYAVSRLAAQHVKMVLTGEGGDELFAGYARYSGERLSPLFRLTPGPLKTLALAASRRLPGLCRPKIALYALCQRDEAARLANWFPLFNRDMKAKLLAGPLGDRIDPHSAETVFARCLAGAAAVHPLNRMLYADTKYWLPDFLLLRGDKLSMAHSLEARVPLLDHRLVEFAASLPPRFKLRGLTRKYVLREVARKYLPPEIIDRPKQGFPIPISQWLRRELRPFARDLLARGAILRRGMFDPQYVERLLSEHESGFADHGLLLWGLMSLEIWHRLYFDSPAAASQSEKSAASSVVGERRSA
jgi:asparagine synthase (glutamine-hydrolysing)